ncbi:MAG: hypothetical protein ABIH04_10420 [Planctomycetota bacterium]
MEEKNHSSLNDETVTGTFSKLAPWTLGARIFVMVMAMVATSILTRTMTEAEWDEYSLLKNMWWYIWLLGQLGLSESALRFGAELSARGDASGFRRLLVRLILIQCIAIGAMFAGFILLRGWLDTLFSVRFGFALIMTVILGAITIFKETLRQGYVAAYWVKLVALMSVVGAATFPAASYVYIVVLGWGVTGGLAGEATGYALMLLVFAGGLPRLKFRRMSAKQDEEEPVTAYRIFRYSGAVVSNNLVMLVFGQNIVVFLVGYFLRRQEGAVGMYNLAVFMPRMGFSFLTLAIIPLVTAMLTKAYYQDRTRLPGLLNSYYKLMILMVVPLMAAGLLFVDKALGVLSGDLGAKAGWLATALLPIRTALILVIPIAAGLNVLEKAQRLIIARILCGIGEIGLISLFLYSWPSLETIIYAHYIASFVFTTIMMTLAVRIVGGFYFPYRFFLRSVGACSLVVLLYPVRFLWPVAQEWGAANFGEPDVGGAALLIPVLILAVVLMVIGARIFGLFGPDETRYFRNAKIPGMKFVMSILVPKKYRPE